MRKTFIIILLFFINHLYSSNIDSSLFYKNFNLLINDPKLNNSIISVSVKSDSNILFQYNPNFNLTPASSLKLFSTALAFNLLGTNTKIETIVKYDGFIIDSTLNGNIFIIGAADPTLGSQNFYNSSFDVINFISREIKKLNINKITGKIYCVNKYFLPETYNWLDTDIGNYYGAAPSFINFNDNMYYIIFSTSDSIGVKPQITKTEPYIPYLSFKNNLTTANQYSGDNCYIINSSNPYNKILNGTIPANKKQFKVGGAMPNPELFFAYSIAKHLNSINVYVDTAVKDTILLNTENLKNITSVFSPTIAEICKITNLKSINLYAESLIRLAAIKKYNKANFYHAKLTLNDFFMSLNLNPYSIAIYDGSGLSPKNAVNSNFFTDFLINIKKEKWFSDFFNSIPIAANSSYLKNLIPHQYANNIRAKSGYMANVFSYAGYFIDKKNQLVAFTIIINGYTSEPKYVKEKIENFIYFIMSNL